MPSKNDLAWSALCDKYDIPGQVERDGSFRIGADRIREFREPRLMAKFDHRLNLPEVFAANGLAILPVSRGEYVISHFDCFMPMELDSGAIRRMRLPDSIQTIDPRSITSESVAINAALASGMFDDFVGEERLAPTVCGRMGSGVFDFRIFNARHRRDIEVRVQNAQIEIDAALEGRGGLALVEAKCDIADDFIIRQLYYPFKTWEGRVDKAVRLVYLVYSNGVFTLYEYRPEDPGSYNSMTLVRRRRYSIEDTEIDLDDVDRLAASVVVVPEPAVPFPQADSFDRVINLCELLQQAPMDKDQVTGRYDFDARQTDYYTTACRYLGLVDKDGSTRPVRYRLTRRADHILQQEYRRRQLRYCECILEHRVFLEAYRVYRSSGRMPERSQMVELMKGAGLYRVRGESTYVRRASTIRGWLEWMIRLCPASSGTGSLFTGRPCRPPPGLRPGADRPEW